MKTLFLTLFICTTFFSFGQKKNNSSLNPNPKASDVIKKIFENEDFENGSIVKEIGGGHRTGDLSGSSKFMIFVGENGSIQISVRSRIYNSYAGRLEEQYQEPGSLINFKFINKGGAYGTKILSADWEGWHAKVNFSLTNDKQKDEIYIEIVGKSNWEHYARLDVNELQFQELVNMLSISKTPQNVSIQKVKEVQEKKVKENQEKVKLFLEEQEKLTKEKIKEENRPKDNNDYEKVKGKPTKFGNLLIAEYRFPNAMNYKDAENACSALGKGWRLPTINELKILCKNQDKIRGFDVSDFWSSTKVDVINAWIQYFYSGGDQGTLDWTDRSNKANVRAVKSIK